MKSVGDFANVVYSVILYGVPVWGDVLISSRGRFALRKLKRSIAQRVISVYRTVSNNAALLLARILPLRFLAPMRKRVYKRCKEHKDRGEYTTRVKDAIKDEEFSGMCNLWRAQLERPNTPGEYTKLAIVPQMDAWLLRDSESLDDVLSLNTIIDRIWLFWQIPMAHREERIGGLRFL